MNLGRNFTSALIVATLSMAAVPVGAQERRNDGHDRDHGRATARAQGPRQGEGQRPAAQERQQAVPRPDTRPANPNDRPVSRNDRGRAYGPPPVSRNDRGRAYGPPPVYRNDRGHAYGPPPVYRNERGHAYGPAYGGHGASYGRPYYLPRPYVRPYRYVPYRPYYFARPYYSFLPRFSIGFGLWIGNPVPYPYGYMGSYRPRVYGYYPDGAYTAQPGVSVYGGVSFDIRPADADLFVDGEYVGPIGDFTPRSEPLTLAPGVHRIAVQRDGFRPMEWQVTIEPGQVIPYRGEMQNW
jgi:hypothetical protein